MEDNNTEQTRQYVRSDESRQRMSDAHKGRELTPEHRQAIGDAVRGRVHSEETRSRMSSAQIGKSKSESAKQNMRKPHKAFDRTDAHREAISRALKGRVVSDETRRKISEAKRGKPYHSPGFINRLSELNSGENNPMYGVPMSAERMAILKEASRGSGLRKHGVSREEYDSQIEAGNKWCFFRKHWAPKSSFHEGSGTCGDCSPDHSRQSNIKRSFGVDQQWYIAKLAEQDGGCAICGDKQPQQRRNHLHIDHDHATQAVRGILCSRCNTALERLETVQNWGILAAAYLVKYSD